MAVATGRPSSAGRTGRALLSLALFGALAAMTLAVSAAVTPTTTLAGIGGVALAGASTWMFFSERRALTLAALVLYLGLLDGYLKLSTGSSLATLGRDVLLYAIVLGLLARSVLRREPLPAPPLTGLVLAFVALTLVQLLNPGTGAIGRGLAALRPHLEFVPLFLLAYMTVTTKRRLFVLALLLAVIGAANGVVSAVQFNLTLEQLSAWGPGYAERIAGTGDVAGRTFIDDTGVSRVRPFGLAADSGGGGLVALLTLPSALALVGLMGRRRETIAAIPLLVGIALAVITSQGRAVYIGAVVALLGYVLLTVTSRRLVPTLASIAVLALVVGLTTSVLDRDAGSEGAFTRFETITPGRVLETAREDRGGSLSVLPDYVAAYPLGAGLGTVGPGSRFGRELRGFNGETELHFLLVELGIVGAAVFLAFLLRLLQVSFTRIRRLGDPELRLLLAGLAAPLLALVAIFFSAAPTSGSPGGPYLWGVAGILLFWLRPAVRPGPVAPTAVAPTAVAPAPTRTGPPRRTEDATVVLAPPMRLTLVYQGRSQAVDAIRSYSRCLTTSLAADLGHEARLLTRAPPAPWRLEAPGSPDERADLASALVDCDAVILQYNPFSYGRWGMAPWLPRALASLRRQASRPVIGVMVHEAYVAMDGPRTTAMGVWQRGQLAAVLWHADLALASTEALAGELNRVRRILGTSPVMHLPVGSNLPDRRSARAAQRASLGVGEDELVVAVFGTNHPARLTLHITAALQAVARHRPVRLLNLGIDAPELRGLAPGIQMIRPGELPAAEVARHLAASDLFLTPLSDGVSSRRTPFVSALQHEIAVVGTLGPNTDRILREADAGLTLVEPAPVERFAGAAVALALDDDARRRRASEGRRLYERHFDWPVIGGRLVEAVTAARAERSVRAADGERP